MDSVEDHAWQWAKREKRTYILFPNGWRVLGPELITSIGQWALAQHQSLKTQMLLNTFSSPCQICCCPYRQCPINIVFVCTSHYMDCLVKEFGIGTPLGNTTYTPTTLTKEKIQDDHRSVLCSFGILTKDEDNKTNDINFLFSSVLCCLGFIIRSFNFAYRVEYSHILPKDLQWVVIIYFL